MTARPALRPEKADKMKNSMVFHPRSLSALLTIVAIDVLAAAFGPLI
jgi:hypothetical protein